MTKKEEEKVEESR